jgi:uncharacterized protein YkwD
MAFQRSTRRGAIWAALLLATCPIVPVAQASDCNLRDLSGSWKAISSNATEDRPSPSFQIIQDGDSLEGSASHAEFEGAFLKGKDVKFVWGTLDGSLDKDRVEFTVYWENNSIGVYTANIDSRGRLEGTGFDRRHPQTTTAWYSSRAMPCLAVMGSTIPAQVPARAPDPASPLERKSTTGSAVLDASKPPVPLGRKQSTPSVPLGRKQAPMGTAAAGSICQAAVSARARNSPAAPALERQCQAYEAISVTPGQRAPAPADSDDPGTVSDDDGVIQPRGTNRADIRIATLRVSELRQQNDLDDVVEDPALTEIAMAHSRQMAAASQLTHTAPGEGSLDTRAADGNFTGQLIYATEQGFDTVLEAWDQMPVQRAKLLSPTSRRIGIAAVNSVTGNTNRKYWTLVVGD